MTQLPHFPAKRPEGMSQDEYKRLRNQHNQMVKYHKRLGYQVSHEGGSIYNVVRQEKKFFKNGWSEKFPNMKEYMKVYEKAVENINRLYGEQKDND